jgi:hypothetical protein
MSSTNKITRRIAISTSLLVLTGFCIGATNQARAGLATQRKGPESKPANSIVVDEDGRPIMSREGRGKSVGELKKFARERKSEGSSAEVQSLSELYVWVTFRRPLSNAEFEDFVKSNQIEVKQYQLRVKGRGNDRLTIVGAPIDGVLIPSMLNMAMSEINKREDGQAELKGFFELRGIVSRDRLMQMVGDSRVFAADLGASVAWQKPEVRQQFGKSYKDYVNSVQISSPSIFWEMEDVGLDSFVHPE